jgi:ferritin-like metal-binding protein YciE
MKERPTTGLRSRVPDSPLSRRDWTMAMQSLEDLFVDKLKDMYDGERRITKALPKMAKTAQSEELRTAFEEHLEQTEGQIERLDRIFKSLGASPGRKMCHGLMGILEEGKELMEKDVPESVMDAALIASAQDVEHYEIASYGCLKTWADLLGKREEARLLDETLREEEETDKKLTQLAKQINRDALAGESEDEEETEMVGSGRSTGRSGSRRKSSR